MAGVSFAHAAADGVVPKEGLERFALDVERLDPALAGSRGRKPGVLREMGWTFLAVYAVRVDRERTGVRTVLGIGHRGRGRGKRRTPTSPGGECARTPRNCGRVDSLRRGGGRPERNSPSTRRSRSSTAAW